MLAELRYESLSHSHVAVGKFVDSIQTQQFPLHPIHLNKSSSLVITRTINVHMHKWLRERDLDLAIWFPINRWAFEIYEWMFNDMKITPCFFSKYLSPPTMNQTLTLLEWFNFSPHISLLDINKPQATTIILLEYINWCYFFKSFSYLTLI